MTLSHLLAFNFALLAAIIVPGPALIMAIQTTLTKDHTAGIITGIGLGSMASIWTLVAVLGLESIFLLFPWAYTGAKILGATYLCFIAWQLWSGAKDAIQTKDQSIRNSFLRGFFVNLLNPKSVLFAASVLVVIFPANMSLAENTFVVLNHIVVEIVFYTLLAFGISTQAVAERYSHLKVYLDRTASMILGGFGLKLLLNR